jgi:putative ABC transport system ATP-binding protein
MFGFARNGKNGGNGGGNGKVSLIELKGIRKLYDMGKIQVEALRGIDLTVQENEFVAIVGPSGSGKSTLMNIVGCLDTPSEGSYRMRGEEVAGFSVDRLAEIRNRHIGFVFQNFNLLPQLTAFENVEMPLLFKGTPARERRRRVEELFEQVGLADRMEHKPTELSGGQMQRAAVARALACEPDIVLADEPTGNLDSSSGVDIIHLFEELWEKGHTLVLITHDPSIARRARRVVTMQDGRAVEDSAA